MRKENIKIQAAVCVFIMTLALSAMGRTIHVDPNGSADFTTIQAAIDDANDGDEIEVAPGTYNEAIDFKGKAVRLYSSGGTEVTTIDASGLETSVATCISGEDANTVLEGFTITGGHSYDGGGMYNFESSPTVINCTFTGNTETNNGGGMYNTFSSPTVTNCTFSGNSARSYGGGMHNYHSSPTVTNCTFIGNTAVYGGGMYNIESSPTVTNCTFSGNTASWDGGGMHNRTSSNPNVTNCTFSSNTATNDGGGIYNAVCSPTMTNCTFSGNTASSSGGGIYNLYSSPAVTNCILWGDTPDEIYNSSSSPTVTYCDVQGGYTGTGNIDEDPLFVNAAGGDFHLLFGSPCIDAGSNSAPGLPVTDFEGDTRIINGIVDMGTDEYICDPATSPSPADGATKVSVDVLLSWTVGVGAVSHDVWFGTDNPPVALIADDITDRNADPGPLEYGVTYYWQVDENTSEGTVTGDVWSFRTEIWEIWVDDNYWDGGDNDGHRWGIDAFDNIVAAIDRSQYGTMIRVAAGTYLERITLKNGVGLIGAGAGDTVIDAGVSGRVVTSSGCDANTIIEGFTITGGYSFDGGGMHNYENSSPTVTNCTFSGNTADRYGGGMVNDDGSSPTVTNCTFSGNSASENGGGMWNYYSSPTINNCTFSENIASSPIEGFGGGMYNRYSSPTVTNCTFSENIASSPSEGRGGGMYNFNNSSPTVTNCTFSGNSADEGGGMYNWDYSSPIVTNCIMWGDSAGIWGDEIYNSVSTSAISYSDIAGCGGSGAGWNGSIGTDGGGNIDAEPLFFASATGDFHLKSEFGRFTMNPSVMWSIDTVTSPCIDAGDPNMDVGNEPEGNGGRINMGRYGGTYQASKSSYVETIEGDVDGDGKVDFKDIAVVAGNWLAGTEPE